MNLKDIVSLVKGLGAAADEGDGKSAAPKGSLPPAHAETSRRAYAALLAGLTDCQSQSLSGGIEHFQTAYILYKQAGDKRSASLVQKVLGLLFDTIKNVSEARTAYRRAVQLLKQAGLMDEAGRVEVRFAQFEARIGNKREAVHAFRAALVTLRAAGDRAGEAEASLAYADFEVGRGRVAEAQRLAREAEALLEHISEGERRTAIAARLGALLAA